MIQRRTKQFPRVAVSVEAARTWLAGELVQISPAPDVELVDNAMLGLSEIATNAVKHGAGHRFTVACTVADNQVTIEAMDGGTGGSLPTVQDPSDMTAQSGRGLYIVKEISGGDWDWDTLLAGRMRVWFRLKFVERVGT
jgi:anti-sigma regulatory factor (Ser/Thr protein kinase)